LTLWIWSFLLEEENLIELAYFRVRSQRKISERTGMSLGTVKSRTASAFKRLRRELAVEDTSREAI